MAHYLVTGGGGFIGSHLVDGLLAAGHSVRVLDDFSNGRRENLDPARAAAADRLTVQEGDLRDPGAVGEAVAGAAGVFHLAALGSVPRSIEAPSETHAVNATGTLNLLEAMRAAATPRIVFAGSSSVYGALEALPKTEEHPTRPISPYGLSKLIGEEYLRLYHELYGMETVTLRYYNVFGPRQSPESQYAAVIPLFITALLEGRAPTVHGDGEQSRDFTYVANVVEANRLAMDAPAEQVAGEIINVAAGGRHSLNDLLAELRALIGTDVDAIHTEPRAGDIKHSQADIDKAAQRLGYRPAITFADGLRKTLETYR